MSEEFKSPYNHDVDDPTQAARYDHGKTRVELIPPEHIEQLGKVFSHGAKKYNDWNWMKGFPWLQPFASAMRHMLAWAGGEDHDDESGLHHLAHAAWNCLAITYFHQHAIGHDDRPRRGVTRPTKKTAYVAGPMRGYPLFNFPAFDAATKVLREAGWIIYNPAESDLQLGVDPSKELEDQTVTVHDCLRRDFELICRCSDIIVLPGWEKSEGVKIELAIAQHIGLQVWEFLQTPEGFDLNEVVEDRLPSVVSCA